MGSSRQPRAAATSPAEEARAARLPPETGKRRRLRVDIWLPLALGGAVLLLMLISMFVPIYVARGDATNLPACYYGLQNGTIHYGALTSGPQLLGTGIEGGRRRAFHHRITLLAPTITIDASEMRGFARVGAMTDGRLRLAVSSPVTVTNARYTRVTIFPRGPLLLCALLCGYVVSVVVHQRVRRLLRARSGLCLHCGYDLTGNVSGRCPECGTALAHSPASHSPDAGG